LFNSHLLVPRITLAVKLSAKMMFDCVTVLAEQDALNQLI
jgi:hypothetical protein